MERPQQPRRRSVQGRTLVTRAKIVDGAIEVLASRGVAGLTHRAVARAAGVSLAATTYHFDSKTGILRETSKVLLDGYLAAFRRLERRRSLGEDIGLHTLDELVRRVVLNALGRERTRSLAWCELVLHGGRSAEGRELANGWFRELDAIWAALAAHLDAPERSSAGTAIDLAVGLTFLLHPLDLQGGEVADLLEGRVDLAPLLARRYPDFASTSAAGQPGPGATDIRSRIVEAAIEVLNDEGAGAVSFRTVSERLHMARSGPNYHFKSMASLLEAAHSTLFERARGRYREGLKEAPPADRDGSRLADLAATIFLREALEYHRENLGYYSVWMSAVFNPGLKGAVAGAVLNLHNAWRRRLEAARPPVSSPVVSLRLQALFIGMLVRALATDTDVASLSRAREAFASVLQGDDAAAFAN